MIIHIHCYILLQCPDKISSGCKYLFKVNNEDTRTTSVDIFLVPIVLILNVYWPAVNIEGLLRILVASEPFLPHEFQKGVLKLKLI